MIKEILEKIEEIKPKSLFSTIEVDRNSIILEIHNFYNIFLNINKINIFVSNKSIMIYKDHFLFAEIIDISLLIETIYNCLNCKLIELNLELITYDVWGNETDGFDVNDQTSHNFKEEFLIHVPTMAPIISYKDIPDILDWENSMLDYGWSDPLIQLKNNKSISWGYFINQESNQKPLGEIRIADNQKNIDILNSLF